MGHVNKNLERDVENQAPNFGMPRELEARFARSALGGDTLGLSLMRLAPGFRVPFGHKHENQEEVYVVLRGSARVKVDDEIVELGKLTRSDSTRTRCGASRQGPRASSTSRSAPVTTLATPSSSRAGGAISPEASPPLKRPPRGITPNEGLLPGPERPDVQNRPSL